MLASDNAVSLLVGGKNYYGWQEMSFQAGLNVIARGCEVSVGTSVTSTDFCEGLGIGEECQIKIGGKTILTGYICNKLVVLSAKVYNNNLFLIHIVPFIYCFS